MLGIPKNGTPIHIEVPLQHKHKHKIKHDKTTMHID